jgi:RimJ/RimL family protein N-acetyltransferase
MSTRSNELGQPIGEPVGEWTPPPLPSREPMNGQWCQVVPLDASAHGDDLWDAVSLDRDGHNWTYLAYGPFDSKVGYLTWLESVSEGSDPLFHTIIHGHSDKAVGVASYMRIEPASGCIEVGHIHYSPLLQRDRAATEAIFLMMQRVFELGYRRYEWKCDDLNAPSRAAAQRYGFSYEGIFRQATLYKGRNRDTAWYAITDKDWPALQGIYRDWLDASNFDADGMQKTSLSAATASVLVGRG